MRDLIHRNRGRGYLVALAAAVAVAGVTGGLLFVPRSEGIQGPAEGPITLAGIDGADLQASGITLMALDREFRPGVGRSAAERLAAARYPDVAVRETILARFLQAGGAPRVDRPAWIVSLDSDDSDLIPEAPGAITEFLLFLVDAETGEFLMGASKSKAPPGGALPPGIGPARLRPLSPPAGQ